MNIFSSEDKFQAAHDFNTRMSLLFKQPPTHSPLPKDNP